jgi:hypothetical protein
MVLTSELAGYLLTLVPDGRAGSRSNYLRLTNPLQQDAPVLGERDGGHMSPKPCLEEVRRSSDLARHLWLADIRVYDVEEATEELWRSQPLGYVFPQAQTELPAPRLDNPENGQSTRRFLFAWTRRCEPGQSDGFSV